ncbi:uncharacterized protein LOC110627278 [Manihot esculenta]|uniref:SMP-30/Gluconolactonase/LRE-like region domain-containing protein n=1 Tax=Manihot esculenta TaxID=3983 RepID=A0A2C9UVN5_MANES|nr:uncharacterized protein LOC110627278 [Manihot esculenta]OAY35554.1 hypothetical protein MANES_12G111500v8 [Manihot esculenta]
MSAPRSTSCAVYFRKPNIAKAMSLLTLFIFFLFAGVVPSIAGKSHVIHFRTPNLYPEGLSYDPSAQHFIVGSLRDRTIHAVSDAGVVETLISDPSLPPNTSFAGLAVDSVNNRLLAVIHSLAPLAPFNALAAYDLRTRQRLFLSLLPDGDVSSTDRAVANAVTVDFRGNAYVTNSLGNSEGNFIWKVNAQGEASIFSRSPIFNQHPVDRNAPFNNSGLNGIAYVSKGYLLVVQSNTGKMFKVDVEDGTARTVLLNEDLSLADGIAMRSDGVVLVVTPVEAKLWFLKSDDSWGEGVVYDKTDLDAERFPTSVAVGREDRAYVIYGRVIEGIMGSEGREWFDIEEVKSERESKEENVWIFVLLGLGLAYFLFWRFQMKQLVKNIDKKTN